MDEDTRLLKGHVKAIDERVDDLECAIDKLMALVDRMMTLIEQKVQTHRTDVASLCEQAETG